jgi:hypothetical protein
VSQGGQVLEVVEGVHDDQAKSLKRDQNTHTSLRKMSPNSQHRSQEYDQTALQLPATQNSKVASEQSL